jgi:hypothetical protein
MRGLFAGLVSSAVELGLQDRVAAPIARLGTLLVLASRGTELGVLRMTVFLRTADNCDNCNNVRLFKASCLIDKLSL